MKKNKVKNEDENFLPFKKIAQTIKNKYSFFTDPRKERQWLATPQDFCLQCENFFAALEMQEIVKLNKVRTPPVNV